jgi:Ulp1 protease family, C-terminal catalytic domain
MSLSSLLTAESTDKQLYELANRLCILLEPIVFKSELYKLPKPSESRNYNYIIHLETPQHWVALLIDNRGHKAYYFNSFADYFGDIPQEIIDFTKKSKCILYTSDKATQNPHSGSCGQYCVLWLKYMNLPTNDVEDFDSYLKLFRDMGPDILKYKEKNPDLPS